ncbi:MAG TPA: adenylate/guanylate cyclase domain-containing protein, partial [Solirubrobacteraceae bacterium]|nr:adenylate/guanylate cyclase domain-containing protein [Solirubrobacteraceae bacterium]
ACGAELVPVPAAGAEERKVVTILFADVTGSTALGERLDAEALKEVMGAFFAAMRTEIEAEGGTVEKFIGDAVMAAFGVPRVHEDDPARALRAALRMRARLAALNEALDNRHGVTLELRIGINTGEVIAATEPRPGEALAVGDAVNAAARLEQAAEPGRVLVSERTARAARGFRFAPPQQLELRGRTSPLRAVELVSEQAIAEGTLSGLRAPLVGRRRELELLTTTYRRVVEEGRPHLVTLYGDAGVGKSRVVAEVLAGLEAATPAPRVLRGRCLAYGDGISFWPLAEMLKAHAGVLDDDPLDVARRRVADAATAALAAAGVDGPQDVAAILGASIGLGARDRPPRSPHELQAETQLAWRSFFSSFAAAAPAVLVVEDVQWADAAVLEVLEDVADRASAPLLILSTARPELTDRRPTWGGGRRRFTGLVVEPLAADESERLVDLLVGQDVDPSERAAILARAEGNPFFLEEIVRTRTLGPGGGIPDTVQAALAARIDLLADGEKRLLQAAAVVGRVFWPGAVAEVAGLDGGAVGELIDRLQDRDLVLGRLSSSMSGERELIFKHALVRDVAYDGLPRRDRVRMHGAVADWIEHAFAERRDEVVELIAHHRQAAHRAGPSPERRAAAFGALAEAAEGAYARAGFEQAASFARDALEVATTPLDRARALEALGHASFIRFDGSTAWDSLREVADIVRSEAPGDRARLARVCAFAVVIPTRAQGTMRAQPPPDEVRPYLELGLASAGDEDGEALARLFAAQGFWDFGFGIDAADPAGDRARRAAERARDIARRLGRPDLELLALDAITANLNVRGLYGQAEPFDRERLVIARGVRDPFEVSDSYYTAAWSAVEVGMYRDAVALATEFAAMDHHVPPIGPLSLSALARLSLGEWDEALADQARVREALHDGAGPPPSFATAGYGTEALIRDARGERDAADAVLSEIDAWAAAAGTARRWAFAQAATTLARRGDFTTAARLLEALSDRGVCVYLPRELEARCTLVAERGAWHEAAAVIGRARRHAAAARLRSLPLHTDRLEGRARLGTGDAAGAVGPLRRAIAGFARLEAAWEVALTELALGEALAALGR